MWKDPLPQALKKCVCIDSYVYFMQYLRARAFFNMLGLLQKKNKKNPILLTKHERPLTSMLNVSSSWASMEAQSSSSCLHSRSDLSLDDSPTSSPFVKHMPSHQQDQNPILKYPQKVSVIACQQCKVHMLFFNPCQRFSIP